VSSPTPQSCPVLDCSELDRFHEEFFAANRPVLIRGFAEGQRPGIFDWSPEFLEARLGDREYPVMVGETGFFSYERDMVPMSYREFMARSFGAERDTERCYYFRQPTDALENLHDDCEDIEPLAGYLRDSVVRNVWVSGPGPTVGMHFDPAENLNFQICGRKRFVTFPPGLRGFYPLPMFSQTSCISGVFRQGPEPDLAKFPLFRPDEGVEIETRAGDLLYLPPYWWHQVESLGERNVNLNVWWFPSAKKQLRHLNQALRGYIQLGIRRFKYGNILKAPPETADSRR